MLRSLFTPTSRDPSRRTKRSRSRRFSNKTVFNSTKQEVIETYFNRVETGLEVVYENLNTNNIQRLMSTDEVIVSWRKYADIDSWSLWNKLDEKRYQNRWQRDPTLWVGDGMIARRYWHRLSSNNPRVGTDPQAEFNHSAVDCIRTILRCEKPQAKTFKEYLSEWGYVADGRSDASREFNLKWQYTLSNLETHDLLILLLWVCHSWVNHKGDSDCGPYLIATQRYVFDLLRNLTHRNAVDPSKVWDFYPIYKQSRVEDSLTSSQKQALRTSFYVVRWLLRSALILTGERYKALGGAYPRDPSRYRIWSENPNASIAWDLLSEGDRVPTLHFVRIDKDEIPADPRVRKDSLKGRSHRKGKSSKRTASQRPRPAGYGDARKDLKSQPVSRKLPGRRLSPAWYIGTVCLGTCLTILTYHCMVQDRLFKLLTRRGRSWIGGRYIMYGFIVILAAVSGVGLLP